MTPPELIHAGLSTPKSVDELVWYGFGLLVTWFLWSIKQGIKDMKDEIKEERHSREGIGRDLSRVKEDLRRIEATCKERSKGCHSFGGE